MATHKAEVFKNNIHDNNTVNISIISYLSTGNPLHDASYDPYVSDIEVRDNRIGAGGEKPAGILAGALAAKVAKPLPSILWDGIVDTGKGPDPHICIRGNGEAKFLNYDAGNQFRKLTTDLKRHACDLPALASVTFAAATTSPGNTD
jgi:hypothetical protein